MITEKQKRFLRSKAHHLKPVVTTGNAGLSEPVIKEIEIALAHHELIKLRISGADREQLREMADEACAATNATLIQVIGHIAIMYRRAKTPKIILPKTS